ncbi:MAG: hypothetical protein C0624_07835 [Desulfuromonas sp.]|nr:MAG: hypothetical protein C0624_07835 [Desulfuromonas sp.]
MRTKSILLLVLVVSFFATTSFAAEVRGTGFVDYKWFNDEVKEEALQKAKLDAWEQFTKKFPRARMSTYQKLLKTQFLNNLDDYMSFRIEGEKRDKKKDRYFVAIRAEINDMAVDEVFTRNSAMGSTDYMDASDFGSLFLARVQTSQKNYDARRVDVTRSESSSVIEETTGSSDSGSVDAVNTKDMNVKESGGSTTRKRAQTNYEINEDYNYSLADVVSERLGDAGYAPLEYDELTDCGAPFIEEVYEEFKGNAKMNSRMIKTIRNSAIDCGWSYFGMGEVTLTGHRVDDSSGLRAVDSNVSYNVWRISDGRARKVASVRNTTFTAMHENEIAAEQEAVIKAADFALNTVIAKLQEKEVH